MGWALLRVLAAVLLAETAAGAPPPAGHLASAGPSPVAARSPAELRDLQRALDELRGQVIASPVLLAAEPEADRFVLNALRRFQQSSFERSAGFWRLHLVAFLVEPAPSSSLTLHIDDLSAPDGPRTTRSIEVSVQPGSRVVHLNDLVISDELGFAPGHTYQLRFSRAITPPPRDGAASEDRKQDAIARGVITLW